MTRLKTFLKLGLKVTPVVGASAYVSYNNWDFGSLGVVRFGRAAITVLKIGIDYKLLFRRFADNSHPDYAEAIHNLHLSSALRLRTMCCKNGGAFIKVGQHLGALEYLLPMEYVSTMKVLHNEAPQSPLEDLKKVIQEDLGKEVEDMFEEFDPEPLGAASLAQVHKARLADGRIVAVKIQHPKVKAHSDVDIKTMEILVHVIGWVFPDFRYVWLAEETKKNLPVELDFINEGRNCEKVAGLLKKLKFLKVPKVYWELSSPRVLTMEFCEGGKADDLQYMKDHNISVTQITERLGQLYSEMIFVQGYVHCDPHPGNVLIKKSGSGIEIVLLDHGLYQTLTDDFRVHYSKMWISMMNADVDGMKAHSEALNVGKDLHEIFACMLTARSWTAVEAGINKFEVSRAESAEIKENIGNFVREISTILDQVPRQMLLLLKTNDVLRSIESSLNAPPSSTSFLNMSRCCVKAVTDWELSLCSSWRCYISTKMKQRVQMMRISLYAFYLRFLHSPLGAYLVPTTLYS